MSLKGYLRGWLQIAEESGANDPKANDEEILNVFRQEKVEEDGRDSLTTTEIKDQLPLGKKQTRKRLKAMDGERVAKRRAGGTDMWSLADSEPETVVNPDLDPIVEKSTKAQRFANRLQDVGWRVAEVSFFSLFLGVGIYFSEVTLVLSQRLLLIFGFAAGTAWGLILGIASIIQILSTLAPQAADRWLID